MDYELHNLVEAAALEAAEPELARDLYRLHAEIARLLSATKNDSHQVILNAGPPSSPSQGKKPQSYLLR